MIIDCDSCVVRGKACGDCVVTVLLGSQPDQPELDADARAAVSVLAASGLVPPLRLVLPVAQVPSGHPAAARRTGRRAAG